MNQSVLVSFPWERKPNLILSQHFRIHNLKAPPHLWMSVSIILLAYCQITHESVSKPKLISSRLLNVVQSVENLKIELDPKLVMNNILRQDHLVLEELFKDPQHSWRLYCNNDWFHCITLKALEHSGNKKLLHFNLSLHSNVLKDFFLEVVKLLHSIDE